MKQIKLSIIALMAMGNLGYAGGDFAPITEYETEDVVLSQEQYVEPAPVEQYVAPAPVEQYVAPVEEYVAPAPVEEYVAPAPVENCVTPAPVEEYIAPAPVEEYVAPVVKEEPVVVQQVTPVTPVPVPLPVKHVAANGFYAGIGIAAARYKTKCDCKKGDGLVDKTAGLMARVGYDFNQHIGLEARGIRTNWKSDGGKVEHAGVFVKPMLPVSDSVNVYGLVGVAKTKTKGHRQKTDAEGLALGAGVELDLSADSAKEGRYNRAFDGKGDQEKGVGVFLDYERMLVKSGAPDLDAVSAGVTYDF